MKKQKEMFETKEDKTSEKSIRKWRCDLPEKGFKIMVI